MIAPLACTIVANNYLAYALAFTRSFLERHPDGKVCVLIVDRAGRPRRARRAPEPRRRGADAPPDGADRGLTRALGARPPAIGIYNLGFLGISFNERTVPFLDWCLVHHGTRVA